MDYYLRFLDLSFFYMAFPIYTFLSLVYIWTGVAFITSGETEKRERIFTGLSFVIWVSTRPIILL